LPVYDNVNGFHNLFFDNYKLTWYDGKSPDNFYIIKNILEGKSIFFPKGYLINNIKVEDNVDFIEKNGFFIPIYGSFSNYIYAGILYFIPFSSDLQMFKATTFLTMLFSAITIFFFYITQRLLGLNTRYAIISTFVAGIATSVLIYSRYLFIDHVILSLLYVCLIYVFLKNQKIKSFKIEILAMIFFSFILVLLWYDYLILISFIFLSYIFIKYRLIRSKKILIFPVSLAFIILIPLFLPYFGVTSMSRISGVKEIIKIFDIPVFEVFSKYINALDYSVFGYHNETSLWILNRKFSYIYAFEELKGNAIFLASYSLFGSLFGPRGFVFNSPYLIFSLLGIFVYERKKERNFLLAIILFIILTYGLLNLRWQGGYSPRYLRYYTIPILFLTFFSFYYIQETKNNLVKLIFLVLVILSILNVTSLGIRADWTYEHEADLVSYDLVLWPWYSPVEEGKIDLLLYTQSEQTRWYIGEDQCVYKEPSRGIITDICGCKVNSSTTRIIDIPWENVEINITACADESGGDGTIGYFKFDNYSEKIFINSNSCKETHIALNNTKGQHKINLQSGSFGKCAGEWVVWKEIMIKNAPK
jgi:hypothetical protein